MDNDVGEHWKRFTDAARTYLDGAARASAPGQTELAGKFGDFLRELFADFSPPGNFGSAAVPGFGSSSASMPESPALGATREHQQRSQRMADAWRRLDEAQRRLQRLWSDVLREAASTFAARIGQARLTAPTAEAVRALYDEWIDSAEDAYSRAAHSELFCNTLAEQVNASSEWRRELRAVIEHAAKPLDLPTRSEINTLTQRLKSVETELRAARDERAVRNPRAPKIGAKKTGAKKKRSPRRRLNP